ncbi:hypothetical protein [Litoribaculum gwangyangense]
MKILISIFLILSTALIYSQTREETLDWLNLKLEEFGDNQIMGTYQISIKKDDNYGDYLLFVRKSWNPLLNRNTYQYYSFVPEVVSKIYLSTKNRTNSTLDIFIRSDTEDIYVPEDDEFVSEFTISMKNGHNEITNRIQKGLLHLLNLMGNNIEPQKELFTN